MLTPKSALPQLLLHKHSHPAQIKMQTPAYLAAMHTSSPKSFPYSHVCITFTYTSPYSCSSYSTNYIYMHSLHACMHSLSKYHATNTGWRSSKILKLSEHTYIPSEKNLPLGFPIGSLLHYKHRHKPEFFFFFL